MAMGLMSSMLTERTKIQLGSYLFKVGGRHCGGLGFRAQFVEIELRGV